MSGEHEKKQWYGIKHNPNHRCRYDPPTPPPRVRLRNITPPDETMAAARLFAAGEIDRAELMRRITPRDKWRGKSSL